MLEQRSSKVVSGLTLGDSTLGQSGVDKKKKDMSVNSLEELKDVNCIDFACGSFF